MFPAFYPTIPVTIDGQSVDLPVTWVSEDYKSNVFGTYTFKAVLAGDYVHHKFANGVTATITVKVLDGAIAGSSSIFGYADSTAGGIDLVVKGLGDGKNQIYDATGCNKLYRNGNSKTADESNFSSGLQMVGGKKYDHSSMVNNNVFEGPTTSDTKIIVTDGANFAWLIGANNRLDHNGNTNIHIEKAKINKVYGGRTADERSANVRGNANIDITGLVNITAIYGGGFKAKVTGDATITLKNDSTVNNDVYAGSFWNDYIGDTTINIESGAKVGKISLGDTPANYPESVSIYVTSGFDLSVIEGVDTGRVKIYVDGKSVYEVTSVEMPEVAVYNVSLGTDVSEIALPATLKATVYGVKSTIENVTWVCDNYNADVAGKYTFKPVIPDNYTVLCDTDHIAVAVRVLSANAGQSVITGFAATNAVSVSYGTKIQQIVLPSTVSATVNGQTVSVEVDQWKCSGYDGFVHGAEYTFTAVVSGEYKLETSAPTVVVKDNRGKYC